MKTSRLRGALVTAGAIVIGAIMAFGPPAGAAVSVQSQSPPVQAVKIKAQGTILANGAAARVPIIVTCPPGTYYGYVTLQLNQKVGNSVANGSTGLRLSPETCDGTPHTIRLDVPAFDRGYRAGVGYAQAQLEICSWNCSVSRAAREIQLVRN